MGKIYNADATNIGEVEKERTNEDVLMDLVARQKDFIEMQKGFIKMLIGQKESLQRNYALTDTFIEENDDLYERYIDHLKKLKLNPEYKGHLQEIEVSLQEFGADEESESYFHEYWEEEEMKTMNGGV